MEFLKQWAITICFAAAAGGIATLLLPQSNGLNKLFRMVAALFFLCSIVLPITSAAKGIFDYDSRQRQQEEVGEMAEQIEKNTEQFAYLLARENINKLIQEKLKFLNIYPKEVAVTFYEENGKIERIHAEIYGDSTLQGREQELADFIKQELGIEAICYFS